MAGIPAALLELLGGMEEGAGVPGGGGGGTFAHSAALLKLDVESDDHNYIIRAEAPGVAHPDDLKVETEVKKDRALIHIALDRAAAHAAWQKSEKLRPIHTESATSGLSHRIIRLPPTVDVSKLQCSYSAGVLELLVPKRAQEGGGAAARKRIQVV